MKKIATIRGDERFKEFITPETTYEKLRVATKVIAFDQDGNMPLVGHTYFVLPGGAVEEGEEIHDAVHRECMEEIGCKVEILEEIGFVEDFRPFSNGRQITYGFSAKIIGEKGKRMTTQADEQDDQVKWMTQEQALQSFDKDIISLDDRTKPTRHSYFNIRGCKVIMEEYLKTRGQKKN